jgi:16S rRNA (uracil1498-N3)-methyltransferase
MAAASTMSKRFFVDQPITGDRATLAGSEAHHLAHVCRARVGEDVVLFDGSGAEFPARIVRIGRAEIELAVISRAEVNRELPMECTLGVALPKGDRQTWLVEKATELGVTRIVPLLTERGVAQPVDKALERLRRAVIEASKQCGRNRLMQIETPQDWSAFVAHASAQASRLIAHPGGEPISQIRVSQQSPFVFGIGPEGGLTDDEVAQATSAGWRVVDLGARILRVETAGVALAAWAAISKDEG